MLRLLFAALAIALALVPAASAGAPGAWTYDCASDIDSGTCERTQYLAEQLPDQETRLDLVWAGVWMLVGVGLVALVAPEWHRAWRWFRVPGGK